MTLFHIFSVGECGVLIVLALTLFIRYVYVAYSVITLFQYYVLTTYYTIVHRPSSNIQQWRQGILQATNPTPSTDLLEQYGILHDIVDD